MSHKNSSCIDCGYIWLCEKILPGFRKPITCSGPYTFDKSSLYKS